MLIVRREFSGSASGAFANPCGLIGELRSVIVTLQQPVHTNSHESPTVNYRKFWPCFGCNIFLSRFAIFHGFAWLHMEMSTREKFAHGGSGHVETVGVRGSNPLSRTIQKAAPPIFAEVFTRRRQVTWRVNRYPIISIATQTANL